MNVIDVNCCSGDFLGLEREEAAFERARYAVLSIPYEGTVSYKAGTVNGPAAIIDASQQVELFDEELRDEFHTAGITTCAELEVCDDVETQMHRIQQAGSELFGADKFVLALGGEHSITAPLVRAAGETFGEISVVQIDAHADLRNAYDGTPHSHASVMRRVLEVTPRIAQVGIRSLSREEFEQCPEQCERMITPNVIRSDPRWIDRVLANLGERVYLTIDIDGLDPSIAPGTGTPEPGGLNWEQILDLLKELCRHRSLIGADIVEVRPLGENHVTEFVAARLAYKIIAYREGLGRK